MTVENNDHNAWKKCFGIATDQGVPQWMRSGGLTTHFCPRDVCWWHLDTKHTTAAQGEIEVSLAVGLANPRGEYDDICQCQEAPVSATPR